MAARDISREIVASVCDAYRDIVLQAELEGRQSINNLRGEIRGYIQLEVGRRVEQQPGLHYGEFRKDEIFSAVSWKLGLTADYADFAIASFYDDQRGHERQEVPTGVRPLDVTRGWLNLEALSRPEQVNTEDPGVDMLMGEADIPFEPIVPERPSGQYAPTLPSDGMVFSPTDMDQYINDRSLLESPVPYQLEPEQVEHNSSLPSSISPALLVAETSSSVRATPTNSAPSDGKEDGEKGLVRGDVKFTPGKKTRRAAATVEKSDRVLRSQSRSSGRGGRSSGPLYG